MVRSKYALVIVEDSDDDFFLFKMALRRSGLNETFEVVGRFIDARQAIEFLADPTSSRPDILIVDIKLLGGTGFDVIRSIRATRRPVIAIFSASVRQEDKDEAERCGADLFQTKVFEPVEFSPFMDVLRRLVDLRRPS